MITRRTTLILGAGASAEYDFPLGNGLLAMLLAATSPNLSGGEVIQALLHLGYTRSDINQFHGALAGSGTESIDAYLEHRQDLVEIGKAAIAAALIAFEKPETLADYSKPSWYRYLFQQMLAPWDHFGENRLVILTYNYDRSLEYFLKTAMREHFRKTEDDIRPKLNEIPIIHLHGDLGSIWPVEENYRPYERNFNAESMRIAQHRIRIIHEGTRDDPVFRQAHVALSQTERICFLGFGFHPVNVERLRLTKDIRAQMYATFYHMTNPEVDAAIALLPGKPVLLDDHSTDQVLPFLRRSGALLQ